MTISGKGNKVRNLLVLGTVLLGGALSGCVLETSSSPPPVVVCDPGSVQAEWSITASGVPKSCQQVGAASVAILVDGMAADFACTSYGGATPTVTGGTNHSVSLQLLDSSGNVLSQTQTMSLYVRCGVMEDIGNVGFSLTF